MHDNQEVLKYWERDEVESMYDKHLLNAEIALISNELRSNSKILDAGCGEGEGTERYASIPGTTVHGVDFSNTRLEKAKKRLAGLANVSLFQVDFLETFCLPFGYDYDFVISQRFLINLMDWDLQKQVLLKLLGMTKPGGKLILLEGSIQGANELNLFRKMMGLDPIPVKWHNLFLDDNVLIDFMEDNNCEFNKYDGLGNYFLLTRGIRPALDAKLNWDCKFNQVSASQEVAELLGFGPCFSRLRLFVFGKGM